MLDDEQWYVRQHAATALGALKESAAAPALRKIRKIERKKAVVAAIEKALVALESKGL